MATILYLLRHGATEANLVEPYRLQGRGSDPDLAPLGVRQAELTRDYLAARPVHHFYASPLRRAVQTAAIIAAPHGRPVATVPELTECDVGRWEGLTWEAVRTQDSAAYQAFQRDPAVHGYPGGETLAAVAARCGPAFERLLAAHAGETLLVVSHQQVLRVYLAGLLGLPPAQARRVRLDNCGISVVVAEGDTPRVETLNATAHLRDASAAG